MKKTAAIFKNLFANLLERDIAVIIISIISAVIIWIFVSVSEYPEMELQINNVPVEIVMTGTQAEENGFQVTGQSVQTVTAYIKGERGQIGDLPADDLKAVVSAEGVIYQQSYQLPMEIVSLSGKKFEVINIEPSHITASFDKIVTKEIAVKPNLEAISVENGYFRDDISVFPPSVTVSGPEKLMESVTDAYIFVKSDRPLSETMDFKSSAPELFGGNIRIQDENIKFDEGVSEFTVHIPIYAVQTVSLDVSIINAPAGFDVEKFKSRLVMSEETLDVASPDRRGISNFTIGAIDMREADIGEVFEFDSANFLPAGYQNLSEVRMVTVTCPEEGLVKKPLTVMGDTFLIVNMPPQYRYEIVTSGITAYFVGPPESMEDISAVDVIAQVDINNAEVFDGNYEGDYKLPVTFIIQGRNDIWGVGPQHKATITITKADGAN